MGPLFCSGSYKHVRFSIATVLVRSDRIGSVLWRTVCRGCHRVDYDYGVLECDAVHFRTEASIVPAPSVKS
jgi:hypothetical protein